VYTDGAIRSRRQVSGLGVIVRDERGAILHCWSRHDRALTSSEAEYAAVAMALERLLALRPLQRPAEVAVFCDSQILVDQMLGRAATRAPHLRQAATRLRALTAQFKTVTFHHIPRDQNRLADALANEAVENSQIQNPNSQVPNPNGRSGAIRDKR
jgi:ribonuclease HI